MFTNSATAPPIVAHGQRSAIGVTLFCPRTGTRCTHTVRIGCPKTHKKMLFTAKAGDILILTDKEDLSRFHVRRDKETRERLMLYHVREDYSPTMTGSPSQPL